MNDNFVKKLADAFVSGAAYLAEQQLRAYLASVVNYNRLQGATDDEIKSLLKGFNWAALQLSPQRGIQMAFESARDKRYAGPFVAYYVQERFEQSRRKNPNITFGQVWQETLPTLRNWGFTEFELVQLRDALFNPNIPLEHYKEGYRFGAPPSSDPLLRTPAGKAIARQLVSEGDDLSQVRPYYERARQAGISQAERERERARARAATEAEREQFLKQLREGNLWEKWAAFVNAGLRGAQRGLASAFTGVPMEELPPAATLAGMISPVAREVESMRGFGAGVARGVLGLADPRGVAALAAGGVLGGAAAPAIARLPTAAQRGLTLAVPIGASAPAAMQSLQEGDTAGALGALAFGALLGAPFAVRGLQFPQRTSRVVGALPPPRAALPPPETPPFPPRPPAPDAPPAAPRPPAPEAPPAAPRAPAPETPPTAPRAPAPETPPTAPRAPAPETPPTATRVRVREADLFEISGRRVGFAFDESTNTYRVVDVDAQQASIQRYTPQQRAQAARDYVQGRVAMQPVQVDIIPVIPPPPQVQAQPQPQPQAQPQAQPLETRVQQLLSDIGLLQRYVSSQARRGSVSGSVARLEQEWAGLVETLQGSQLQEEKTQLLQEQLREARNALDALRAAAAPTTPPPPTTSTTPPPPATATTPSQETQETDVALRNQALSTLGLIREARSQFEASESVNQQELQRAQNTFEQQIRQLLQHPRAASIADIIEQARGELNRLRALATPSPEVAITLQEIQRLREAVSDATNRFYKRQLQRELKRKAEFVAERFNALPKAQQSITRQSLPALHRQYLDEILSGKLLEEVRDEIEAGEYEGTARTRPQARTEQDAEVDSGELGGEPPRAPLPADAAGAAGSAERAPSARGADTSGAESADEAGAQRVRRIRNRRVRPAAEPDVGGERQEAPAAVGGGAGREGSPSELDSGQLGGTVSQLPDDARSGGHNYRFTDDDRRYFSRASETEKIQSTLEAIRTLKSLEATGRPPTLEDQQKLARFAGWGAIWRVLDPNQKMYAEYREELTQLLSPEELEAARRATLNAHYTTPQVIELMWQAARQLGFSGDGARILEPAAGIGLMAALCPEPNAAWTMVELDKVTARILKYLYPEYRVYESGFEQIQGGVGQYDLVISNVPFGNFGVVDPNYPTHLTRPIHDYFLVKGADMLREGGLMIVISSRFTLDKEKDMMRRALAQRGMQLLAAYRLPNRAFADFAATRVVTDLLIFQKQANPQQDADYIAVEARELSSWGTRKHVVKTNAYYARHPQHIVGRETIGRGMYSDNEYTVEGELDDSALQRLQRLIEKLPAVYTPASHEQEIHHTRTLGQAIPYRHIIFKDKLYRYEPEEITTDEGKPYTRITLKEVGAVSAVWKDYIELRDALVAMLQSEARGENAVDARQRLQSLFEQYRARYGRINPPRRKQPWDEDIDAPLVRLLETPEGEASELLNPTPRQRQLHIDTPEKALYASLSLRGRIDLEWMAAQLGKSVESIENALQPYIIQTVDGDWQLIAEFVAGNVGQKYLTYQELAKSDPRWQRHVALLKEAMPPRTPLELIDTPLGAAWIPLSYKENFFERTLGVRVKLRINERGLHEVTEITQSYGVRPSIRLMSLREAKSVIEYALNDRPNITAKRNNRVDEEETERLRSIVAQIQNQFKDWLLTLPAESITRLEDIYLYNMSYREVDYTDVLPYLDWSQFGMNPAIQLYPHQKRAILRILRQQGTLLDHEVGSGKTFTLTAAAIIAKRIGLVRKPVIIVEKQTLEQFHRQARLLFPDARILAATEQDFSTANRRRFLALMATGNWDVILLTHEQFKEIPISDETIQAWIDAELDAEREYLAQGMTLKDVEKALVRLENRLKQYVAKVSTKRKFGLDFESIGIDMLLVDESQNWKGMPFYTVISDAQYPVSEIGMDGYLKSEIVRRVGGKVVYASGTPLVNKLSEMYIIMRAINPQLWQSLGIRTFEEWRQTFAVATAKLERRPTGEYKVTTRLNEYLNVRELFMLYRQVADVFYIEDNPQLKEALPKLENEDGVVTGKPIIVRVPSNPAVQALAQFFQDHIAKATDFLERGAAVLQVYNWAKRAIVDPRLVDIPDTPDTRRVKSEIAKLEQDTNVKLKVAADKIAQLYHDTAQEKRTQLVFMDRGVPNSGEWDAYNYLKRLLIARGVPKEQIAFVHDAKNDKARGELFEKVNRGEIRVLVGSTEKMGVGVNVQQRLIASHYIDVPWRPADLEQRDGRIRRQGNLFERVRIYHYVQEGSPLEEVFWTLVSNKQQFLRQARKGVLSVNRLKEIDDDFDAREVLAAIAVTPEAREYAQVLTELDNKRRQLLAQTGKVSAHRAQMAHFQALLNQIEQQYNLYNIKFDDIREIATRLNQVADAIETLDIATLRPLSNPDELIRYLHYDEDISYSLITYAPRTGEVAYQITIGDEVYALKKYETDEFVAVSIEGYGIRAAAIARNKNWAHARARLIRAIRTIIEDLTDYVEARDALIELRNTQPAVDENLQREVARLEQRKRELESALNRQTGVARADSDIIPSLFGGLQLLYEKIEQAILARLSGRVRVKKQRQPSALSYFRSPIGIYDIEGNPIGAQGYYEVLGGSLGRQISEAFVEAQEQLDKETNHFMRRIEVVLRSLDKAYRQNPRAKKETFIDQFIELVELPYDHPRRQQVLSSGTALGEALRAHDELTEEWRRLIIEWRRSLGIPTPDDWGITEQGYFRHLFSGDVVVYVEEGEERRFIGAGVNYVEALAIAYKHLRQNPQDRIVIDIRRPTNIDPTVRVSSAKYWRLVNELKDRTMVTAQEVMEDLRGIVGRKSRQRKVLGLEKRRTGAEGWSRDYVRVMSITAAQIARARALTRLKREVQPLIEQLRKHELYGLAEHVEAHLNMLWGETSPLERDLSRLLQNLPIIGNLIAPSPYAFRALAGRLTRLQAWLKLEAQLAGVPLVIRPALVNLLDPLRTLFPFVSARELAWAYVQLMRKSVRDELYRLGVVDLRAGLKVNEGALLAEIEMSKPSYFRRASMVNRAVGYLIGRKRALDKGYSREDAHRNGLRWARRTEYDNSMWYCAPILRSAVPRVILQFRGYQLKAIEDFIFALRRGGQGGGRGGGGGGGDGSSAAGMEPLPNWFARVAKLVGAQLVVGGIKGLTGVFGTLIGAFLIYKKLKESLKQEGFDEKEAELYARAVYFGAPALLGVELTASVTLWELPYGYTPEERVSSLFLGPTGTNILALANPQLTVTEKLKRTTPMGRWVEVAPQLYAGEEQIRIGRSKRTGLVSRQEAVLYALGFQPVNRSIKFEEREFAQKGR